MLEQQLLVLRMQPTATSQTVVEAGSGAPLGFTRWRRARTWFQRLFVGDVLEVHEHEDEPLLFTVRRCWSFAARSLVWDADDMPVGVLDGTQLLDRLGRLFSVRQKEGDRVVFRTTTGVPSPKPRRRRKRFVYRFTPSLKTSHLPKCCCWPPCLAFSECVSLHALGRDKPGGLVRCR